MASEHYHFTAGFNLAPDEIDLTVLFSGEGNPVPGHKMGPSVHDYFLIHTVLDGKGCFRVEVNLMYVVREIPLLFSQGHYSVIRQTWNSLGLTYGSPCKGMPFNSY